jgi:putative ABC transport system permease protein
MTANVRLAVGLCALLAVGLLVLTAGRIPLRGAVLTAGVRAAVQLAVVAAALRGAFAYPPVAVAIVAVMFAVATVTAARRLRALPGATRAVVLACGAGAVPVVAAIVGAPILDRDVRDLVAVAGIVIGGTMTAATLSGRRLADGLHRRRDEVEAWLAIGATSRQAVRDIARSAVVEALVPALDQTRTVGLVTLPGAFIGALLGGADATAAARFQLTVLVGLLCAEAITAVGLTTLLGAPAQLPAPEGPPVRERRRARPSRVG